jgi:hypothetical protein
MFPVWALFFLWSGFQLLSVISHNLSFKLYKVQIHQTQIKHKVTIKKTNSFWLIEVLDKVVILRIMCRFNNRLTYRLFLFLFHYLDLYFFISIQHFLIGSLSIFSHSRVYPNWSENTESLKSVFPWWDRIKCAHAYIHVQGNIYIACILHHIILLLLERKDSVN